MYYNHLLCLPILHFEDFQSKKQIFSLSSEKETLLVGNFNLTSPFENTYHLPCKFQLSPFPLVTWRCLRDRCRYLITQYIVIRIGRNGCIIWDSPLQTRSIQRWRSIHRRSIKIRRRRLSSSFYIAGCEQWLFLRHVYKWSEGVQPGNNRIERRKHHVNCFKDHLRILSSTML